MQNRSLRGVIGCLAANRDPMALRHRHPVEQAARCDTLYLPVVSEDRSAVPAVHRRRIGEWAVGTRPM